MGRKSYVIYSIKWIVKEENGIETHAEIFVLLRLYYIPPLISLNLLSKRLAYSVQNASASALLLRSQDTHVQQP